MNCCSISKLQSSLALESTLSTGTRLRLTLFLLAVIAWPSAALLTQESAKALPEVTEHGTVAYPPLARQARIQGTVRLRLTTNGHAITDVVVLEGHPLLVQSATDNVRTWKFVEHAPATFDVTFNFRMLDNAGTFLQQPGLVQVVSSPECCIDHYTFPEKWNAQVRNAEGTIETILTLWTYHSFEVQLDGYTTGPQGQERVIRNPHFDGDMLGFDATLDDKYGQRLKFSMIGKMTGNEIRGVFLNYWGSGGTWTAERVAKTISEPSSSPLANASETKITESDVAYHAFPGYSYFANEAGIQGTVQLHVTTNGVSVTKFDVESGNPFLVREATENLRSWRFARNAPRTFEVTYTYELKNAQVAFLEKPGVVTVEGTPPLVNGIWSTFDTPPQIWQMELTSSRGGMHAKLSLVNTYDMPDGYVTNEAPGSAGKKREVIRQGHQDEDMIGFDATVNGPDGKPLKVSVLGKKTGNKITGVFLDYSGMPGTWKAVRQASHAKPPQ
jgi:outer membrane biosynthesis protein TonB